MKLLQGNMGETFQDIGMSVKWDPQRHRQQSKK
jgi:hypothetical protein